MPPLRHLWRVMAVVWRYGLSPFERAQEEMERARLRYEMRESERAIGAAAQRTDETERRVRAVEEQVRVLRRDAA